MLKGLIVILAAMFVVSTASAAETLNSSISGKYSKGAWVALNPELFTPTEGFDIIVQGSRLTLKDNTNNILYNFDVNNKGEQDMPASYLSYLRKRTATTFLAPFVSKVTVSNIRVINGNKIAAVLNYYVGYSHTEFGGLGFRVQLGFSAEFNARCEIPYTEGKTVGCFKFNRTLARVSQVSATGLGDTGTKVIGIALDLAAKVVGSGNVMAVEIYKGK